MNRINLVNDKSLSGSIVLVKGTHFLSKQIIMHMKILAIMLNKKHLKFSHAETLIFNENTKRLYTVGARKSGAEISPATDYYKEVNFLILKPKKSLSDEETEKLWAYFTKIDASKYQFGNLFSWITYMKTLIWVSSKGDNKTYCYEMAARMANEVGRWNKSKSLDQVSIYDLYENENFKPLEND